MVTIGQLILATAEALGISHGTVTMVARYLRDANLLTSSGRGPSAAAMSRHDVAKLLIAFLTIDRSEPRLAADAVEYYAGLPYCGTHRDTPPQPLDFVSDFGLPEEHTFEDAIAKIFQIYSDKTMSERLEAHAWGGDDLGRGPFLPVLKVTVSDNLLNATINLNGTEYIYTDPRGLDVVIGSVKPRQDEPRYQALLRLIANRPTAGLRTERWFTWSEVNKLLVHLHKLVHPTIHAGSVEPDRLASKPKAQKKLVRKRKR